MYNGQTVQRSDVDGFIPNKWQQEIRYYRNRKFVMKICCQARSFVGKLGDTLYEPLVGRAAIFPKLGGQPVNLQVRRPGAYEMKIDKHNESSFGIEDIVDIQSQYNLRVPYTREAGYAMSRDIDNSLLALRAAVPLSQQIFRTVGTGAGTAAGTPAAIDSDSILAAKSFLEERDVPADELILVVAPGQYNDLLNIDKFINADFVNGYPIVNGIIGSLYGMRVMSTSNLTTNTLDGYRNGEGAVGQPTPGVLGSPYMPTQDVIIGTGLPRGQTGSEVAAPFVTAFICHKEWAMLGVQKNVGTEASRETMLLTDVLVTHHVFGAKTRRLDHIVLIHTAP